VNPQIMAALIMHDFFFEAHKVEYAVIGGIALQFWGEPRFTRDVDITVENRMGLPELLKVTTEAFGSRVPDPLKFAEATRMILLQIEKVDVDIALAFPGYEEHLFRNVTAFEVEQGRELRICSAEDLIIHKAVAGRPQDLADIKSIVYRQGDNLEVKYIRRWLREFADALSDRTIPDRFNRAWQSR